MLIAFEGIDGSGKQTQVEKLTDVLGRKIQVEEAVDDLRWPPDVILDYKSAVSLSFPDYQSTFGRHIRAYLDGEFGPLRQNHPLLVAMLYANDRLMRRPLIMQLLELDAVVICDRYVHSNVAHQAGKCHNPMRRNSIRACIEEIEFDEFKMPRPDLVFLLDITAEESMRRTKGRDAKSDVHQDSLRYLRGVREMYLDLAKDDKWHVIQGVNAEGTPRTVDDIHREIWDIVAPACKLAV